MADIAEGAAAPGSRTLLRSGEQRSFTSVKELAAYWPGARFSSESDPFMGQFLRLQFAHLMLDTAFSSPYVCARDEDLIARYPRGTVALDVVLTGALWRQHAGARSVQAEGQVCLTVVDEPFAYGWIRGGRSVRTISAIQDLPSHARKGGTLCTGVLAPTPLVASYVGFITGLIGAATPDVVNLRQLESALSDVHRAVVLEAALPAPPNRPSLRTRIDEYIEERFADPLLTPSSIAQQLEVSLRSVHQAVEGEGPTLARQIRERRVRAAAAALQYDGVAPTMHDLANQFGFSGVDQLRRSFHMVLGMNASTYRELHHNKATDTN